MPSWNALGGIGIILGLACIIYDNIAIEKKNREAEGKLEESKPADQLVSVSV